MNIFQFFEGSVTKVKSWAFEENVKTIKIFIFFILIFIMKGN